MNRLNITLILVGLLTTSLSASGRAIPESDPETLGFDPAKLSAIDGIVDGAISSGQVPGAVVIVGRKGAIVYAKSFGDRCVDPAREPLTRDTIFDLASLTKPLATATSVMILVDRGKIRLDDTLAKLLPEFDNHGKGAITVEQLLRHRAGLIPDNTIDDYADGPESAWQRLANLDLTSVPGAKFSYSDVGFLILGRIVEKVSGMPLDEFATENIYRPLRMTDSHFPGPGEVDETRQVRAAPTEKVDGAYLRGVVHDPRARALGGVGGHAGLFATADDVAIFANMMLSQGKGSDGQVILKPETVDAMINPGTTPELQRRGLGWDVDTPFSAPRGKAFGPRSYGHTGFTGTSIWIDPDTETFVIILASRLYPKGSSTSTNRLRASVATAVAEALKIDNPGLPETKPSH